MSPLLTHTTTRAGETSSLERKAPEIYARLISLMRLPGRTGHGIYNEATLYHDGETRQVSWTSSTVDARLRRGDVVTVRAGRAKTHVGEMTPVQRIVRVDQAVPVVNPFALIPPTWFDDREIVRAAAMLWGQMERPLQHLVNAVLWDGARFYRYVTGPASTAEYPAPAGGGFRRAVACAEEARLLADGLPKVARGVLIAAALLHEAGKADDFRLSADGSGLILSERGRWIGYRQTLLEWLAVARTEVIVPDGLYHRLVHVLLATHRASELPPTIEAAILNVARNLADGLKSNHADRWR